MNFDRWKHLQDNDPPAPHCMDWRHVMMIHAVLINERPKSVVEIGIWNGFSTAASVEAIELGFEMKIDFVDKQFRDPIREIVKSIKKPESVRMLDIDSAQYNGSPECWIIDGDHGNGAAIDYHHARTRAARIVIIHDTNPECRPDRHPGSIEIGGKLKRDAVCYFEDLKLREKENTERGLVIGFFYEPGADTIEALQKLAI